MLCDSLHAWRLTKSWLTTVLPSLLDKGSDLKTFNKVGWGSMRGSTVGFLLFQYFSKGIAVEYSSCFISALNLDLYVGCFDAWMRRNPSRERNPPPPVIYCCPFQCGASDMVLIYLRYHIYRGCFLHDVVAICHHNLPLLLSLFCAERALIGCTQCRYYM